MKQDIFTPLKVFPLFHEIVIFEQNSRECLCICASLARVIKSHRGRNWALALAAVHEKPFAFPHCAIGDLLGVSGTQ
jgi:hypothetical protein